LDTHRLITAL